MTAMRRPRADKGRRRLRTEGGEIIRAPHSTPCTIVVHWDRVPANYHAECNVAQCTDRSTLGSKDSAKAWSATHQSVFH